MSYIGTQPTPQSLESRQEFTATVSQTTFATSGYTVGYVDVYLNGVKLSTSDFTATNGSDIVLGSGATAGDVLAVVMKNDHSDLVALPITDSQGNNVLSESGGTVTLTADEANVGSNALVVDSSGDALIGTTSKTHSAKLTVNKTSGVNTTIIAWTDSANNTGKLSIRSGSVVGIGADGNLAFSTGESGSDTFNERMRIDSNGTVFFGGGYAPDTNTKITFYATPTVAGLATQNTSLGSVNKVATFRANNTTEIGHITCSNSSTSFSTTSDYRLKENITEITDGINRVKQLNPSRFNFITDPDRIVDGFIAHEVQDIVPEAITGEKDAVNEDESINPQGIDQSKLVPLLTAALQEAIALIESQQSQIDTLTTKTQEQDLTIASLISRIEALETPAE
jgi:hypothetical protein